MEFKKRKIKLFILSGKARSGKDSVYQIIKEYYKDKKTINVSFGHYIKDYAKRVSDWDGKEETKPRELLQSLGIELVKKQIDDKLFIRRLMEDIVVFSYFYDIIVVTDARLVDEIEELKAQYPDSISVRINRDFDNGLSKSEKEHLTEIALDNYDKFDYVVLNDDKTSLKSEIIKILNEVQYGKNNCN